MQILFQIGIWSCIKIPMLVFENSKCACKIRGVCDGILDVAIIDIINTINYLNKRS